jgi:hypothetical protein
MLQFNKTTRNFSFEPVLLEKKPQTFIGQAFGIFFVFFPIEHIDISSTYYLCVAAGYCTYLQIWEKENSHTVQYIIHKVG